MNVLEIMVLLAGLAVGIAGVSVAVRGFKAARIAR